METKLKKTKKEIIEETLLLLELIDSLGKKESLISSGSKEGIKRYWKLIEKISSEINKNILVGLEKD